MSEVKTDKISSVSTNGDITLDPDGTGDLIVASGNVGIGTTSPSKPLHVSLSTGSGATPTSNSVAVIDGNDNTELSILGGSSSVLALNFGHSGDANDASITYNTTSGSENMALTIDAAERTRIQSGGIHRFYTTQGTGVGVFLTSLAAGTSYNLIQARNAATSITGGTQCFFMTTNGNMYNTNNSYNGMSDSKLKENIVDATSQWDDIKAMQIRKYNMIGDDTVQLGVVAQELETAGMNGLVTTRADRDEDGNDLGTTTKSVKYSVLYMKAVKALQEAMTKIETLETEMTALKARVTALEDA